LKNSIRFAKRAKKKATTLKNGLKDADESGERFSEGEKRLGIKQGPGKILERRQEVACGKKNGRDKWTGSSV